MEPTVKSDRRAVIVIILLSYLLPPALWIATLIVSGVFPPSIAGVALGSPVLAVQAVSLLGITLYLYLQTFRLLDRSLTDPTLHRKATRRLQLLQPIFLGLQVLNFATGPIIILGAAGTTTQLSAAGLLIGVGEFGFVIVPCVALLEMIMSRRGIHLPLDKKTMTMSVQAKTVLIVSMTGVSAYTFPLGLRIADEALSGGATSLGSVVAENIVPVLIAAAGIAVMAVILRLVIVKPLADLTGKISVAKTNDFVLSVGRVYRDDIGLAQIEFVDMLRTIAASISESKTLFASVLDSTAALDDSTGSVSGAVAEMAQRIAEIEREMADQASNVTETSAAVEEIVKNIESLSRNIDAQVQTVSESSAAVEEMIASIESISEMSQRSKKLSQDLAESAERGKRVVSEVNATMTQIESNSAKLQEANTLIAGVAAQTNLLAMNAAIEAAHAGEAGRGFSVVASEIRTLAEKSGVQSKSISANLKSEIESVQVGVGQTSVADQALVGIAQYSSQVEEITKTIETALREQTTGSNIVLSSLSKVDEISSQVRTGAVEMNTGSKEIVVSVRNLSEISSAVSTSSREIGDRMDHIRKLMEEMEHTTDQTRELVGHLRRDFDKYKIE